MKTSLNFQLSNNTVFFSKFHSMLLTGLRGLDSFGSLKVFGLGPRFCFSGFGGLGNLGFLPGFPLTGAALVVGVEGVGGVGVGVGVVGVGGVGDVAGDGGAVGEGGSSLYAEDRKSSGRIPLERNTRSTITLTLRFKY